jgi:conjugal transfer mating pair stabilization protein TraN
MVTAKLPIILVLVTVLWPSGVGALVCGKDLDGNGKATGQGETAQCVGDGGTLCPIEAIKCTAETSEPTCPKGGVFVPERDRCEATVPPFICSLTGQSFDSLGSCASACTQTATCIPLIFGIYLCPLTMSFCGPSHVCSMTGTCSRGQCAVGYTWDGTGCTAALQCAKGRYNPLDKQCVDETSYRCPYGDAFACIDNEGTKQCSQLRCFDPNAPGNEVTQSNNSSMLQNDGQKDGQGNCLGSLYIFSGRSMECRTSGQQTGWKNCCLSGESPLADDVGSAMSVASAVSTISNVYHMGQVAYYGNMIVSGTTVDTSAFTAEVQGALTTVGQTGSIMDGLMSYAQATFLNPTTLAIAAALYLVEDLLLSGSCNQDDVETAMLDSSGMCHYLDTYCKKKWPLVGCVQEAKVFCCFNSKLARIVHEQGRPQLKTFSPPWPYVDSSGNCRGFTPSEFQMLDFSKMNLSEYLGDIKTKAQAILQNTVTDKIQQYYQRTRP